VQCKYGCEALFFTKEKNKNVCCFQSKIQLPEIDSPPEFICELLSNNKNISKEFRNNIRAYNSSLAFTSIGYNQDERFSNNGSKYIH
jgi:hypothetical protein